MLLNLSDVLTSEGEMQHLQTPLEMDSFDSPIGNFPVQEKNQISFTFTNIGVGKARMEGNVKLTFKSQCDRCLTDVPVELQLTFDREVASPEVDTDDEDNLAFMDGYQLDVEAFVHNEVLLNWPAKILCRKDCKGICPVCGQNLNNGDCGCDTFVPDPRMAAIKDIFNANKEV